MIAELDVEDQVCKIAELPWIDCLGFRNWARRRPFVAETDLIKGNSAICTLDPQHLILRSSNSEPAI